MYIYIHFDVVGKKTLVKGSRLLVVTRMQDDFKHVYFIELIFFGWSFFYVLKIKTKKDFSFYRRKCEIWNKQGAAIRTPLYHS